MIGKYNNKKKFVERGVYFVLKGEYKGSFIMNIKDLNTPDEKIFLLFPDQEVIKMTNLQIKDLFEKEYFEYVKTIPKKIYNVCALQVNGEIK